MANLTDTQKYVPTKPLRGNFSLSMGRWLSEDIFDNGSKPGPGGFVFQPPNSRRIYEIRCRYLKLVRGTVYECDILEGVRPVWTEARLVDVMEDW